MNTSNEDCVLRDHSMKTESSEIPFTGKCDVLRVKNSPLYESTDLRVRLDIEYITPTERLNRRQITSLEAFFISCEMFII
jgi:hypothetical protein